MKKLTIYTDGSANNRVPIENRAAGYAALFFKRKSKKRKLFTGSEGGLNSYQAELCGCILALSEAVVRGYGDRLITIFCDCEPVVNAYSKNWIENWRRDNYSGRDELVKELDEIILEYDLKVNFKWIRGHSGIIGNEICDKEARKAREDFIKRNPTFK